MQEILDYAKRVARRMLGSDAEADSIAGLAAWRAARTYDGQVPLKRWVALCVRTDVHSYWRKRANRREKQANGRFFAALVAPAREEETEWSEGYQMLCERYLQRWCIDVVARRHGVKVPTARRMMAAALERLRG
jgi:DNA-directed RNA polymerase specialized sigma24 family protein